MIKNIFRPFFEFRDYENKIYKLYCKSHKYHHKKNFYNQSKIDYFNYKIYKKYNCIISGHANIESKLTIPHPIGIVIGGVFGNNTTSIGKNVTIYQNVTIGQKESLYPKIGDNVTIYAGAVIIGNVKIGNNVIIGANSVVTHDIPDDCIVAGVPARIIKRND